MTSYSVGIDIGHSTISFAQVERNGSTLRIAAWGSIPMPENCVVECQRFSVMHEAVPGAQAPQWCRAYLVSRRLTAVLDDAVACVDGVE